MKIFAISDFHGSLEILEKLRDRIIKEEPELIVFCGDIVKGYARGDEYLSSKSQNRNPNKELESIKREKEEDRRFYEEFYNFIESTSIPFVGIPGNMDAPEKRYFTASYKFALDSKNIEIVQENILRFKEFIISGFGGEISKEEKETFFLLIYPEIEANNALKRLKYIQGRKILLFHNPPIGKVVDIEEGRHRGSKVVNILIEMIKPEFVFCGHAHNAQGYEVIKESLVVNPGALKKGNYAIVDTQDKRVELKNLNDER